MRKDSSSEVPLDVSDATVLMHRGAKNKVDPFKPYYFLVEEEFSHRSRLDAVATLFLTNRECPFRCTMCDLWKNTLDGPTPEGAIPAQIDYALSRLEPAHHIKLYNSGNFFDPLAIPPSDYSAILGRVGNFDSIIVENHPRLCGTRCFDFQERSGGRLEVALGLETAEPTVLAGLNKQLDLKTFEKAVAALLKHQIRVRAFILLQPPGMPEERSVEWCLRTVKYAFDTGVECCSIIPTRGGNGLMDRWAEQDLFEPPTVQQLEDVFDASLELERGRVFVDLWDFDTARGCEHCRAQRRVRLDTMNRTQQVLPPIKCDQCSA